MKTLKLKKAVETMSEDSEGKEATYGIHKSKNQNSEAPPKVTRNSEESDLETKQAEIKSFVESLNESETAYLNECLANKQLEYEESVE